MIKMRLWAWILLGPVALTGFGCNGDSGVDFSGNVKPVVNVTGNYEVKRTPVSSINNITLTQTNNRVQAVDNTGVVYTGTTPGDIATPFTITGTGTAGISTSTPYSSNTSMTIQGSNAAGIVKTIILTTITYFFNDPFTAGGSSDITVSVRVVGLAGTYTDTAGASGAIELVSNTLQPDVTFGQLAPPTPPPTVAPGP